MAHTERKRILIWGKTRPEQSRTYTLRGQEWHIFKALERVGK
jgi:hypothetical protein